MNFYNPYYSNPFFSTPRAFLKGGLNLSNILNGTQKTLNIINQAIPIIKEAAPMMKNAKTMFKVMNEFKKVEAPSPSTIKENKNDESNQYTNDAKPTFFA